MKRQIVLIHGGETFDTYEEYLAFLGGCTIDFGGENSTGWKDVLEERFGETCEVVRPRMPSPLKAKYVEWKLWFEKYVPFLRDDLILVGHSLGGIFLAKYLSENIFPKKIAATFLVAAPYDTIDSDYTLADFVLPSSLDLLAKQGGRVVFLHSSDDPVVPFVDLEKYRKSVPSAEVIVCEGRGHFITAEFPELIEKIKELTS